MEAWSTGGTCIHVACDDIESLGWVLLWVLIVKAKENGMATPIEEGWLSALDCNDDLVEHLLKKTGIVTQLKKYRHMRFYMTPFLDLLLLWFNLCEQRADTLRTSEGVQLKKEEEDEMERKELYLPIIRAAMQMLRENSAQLQQWPSSEDDKQSTPRPDVS